MITPIVEDISFRAKIITRVLAENQLARSIALNEFVLVGYDHSCLAGRERHVGQYEVQSTADLETLHVQRCGANVLHFQILEVFIIGIVRNRILRMVHDLRDAQRGNLRVKRRLPHP